MNISNEARTLLFSEQTAKNRDAIMGLLDTRSDCRCVLGKSLFGQDIWMHKVGEGRRRVAFFATHHALEDIGSSILYAIIYILLDEKSADTFGFDRKLLLKAYSFYFVPAVNPDGVELRYGNEPHPLLRDRLHRMSCGDFSRWQANGRGVDLNHNYDYRFSEYKVLERERGIFPGRTLYGGESPLSEPESSAVIKLLSSLDFSAVISLHSQGEELYYSPYMRSVGRAAERFCAQTGYRIAKPDGTACYGGLCDYTGFVCGIPSFTVEVGRGENPLPVATWFSAFERIASALIELPLNL